VDDSKTLSRSHSAVVEKRERRRSNIETLRSAAKVRPRAPFYSRRMRTLNLDPKVGKMGFAKSSGTRELLCAYHGPQTHGSNGLDTEELQQVSKP